MMKNYFSCFGAMVLLALSAMTPAAAQVWVLYSVAATDAQLRIIDPANAQTLSSVTMTLSGEVIQGARGLAADPLTNTLYALLTVQSHPAESELVTVNPQTGAATAIGNTGDLFDGLAFKTDGTLYAVSDEAASIPTSLFTLNKVTAAPTTPPVLELGNGGVGEAIAISSTDGLLYHASGDVSGCSGNSGVCFESVNLGTLAAPTNIDISATDLTNLQVQALTYWPQQNVFLWKQGTTPDNYLNRVTSAGVVTLIGTMDHLSQGLAFVDPPPVSAELESGLAFMAGLLGIGLAFARRKGRR